MKKILVLIIMVISWALCQAQEIKVLSTSVYYSGAGTTVHRGTFVEAKIKSSYTKTPTRTVRVKVSTQNIQSRVKLVSVKFVPYHEERHGLNYLYYGDYVLKGVFTYLINSEKHTYTTKVCFKE